MLFLIATPIGNLEDITLRALKALKSCDYLLCEDTRRTRILLNHYEIKLPLKSFHHFNEASKENAIIEDLKGGLNIGLVSDAGTPGIADPGERLVQRCVSEKIEITALPGPCAAIMALTLSGMQTSQFQFIGFLARKKGRLTKELCAILNYPGSTICYESPYRLVKTLEALAALDPNRACCVGRELTKKFETILHATAFEMCSHFKKTPPKGEIVLIIHGIDP